MRFRWWKLVIYPLTLMAGVLVLQMVLFNRITTPAQHQQDASRLLVFVSRDRNPASTGTNNGDNNSAHRPAYGVATKRFSGHLSDSIGFKGLENFDCVSAIEGFRSGAPLRPPVVVRTPDEEFIERTKDCRTFRERYGYNRYPPATAEELRFPLAFNILMYKEVEQLHMLLRALYRPHNSYCLHVDGLASAQVFDATQHLAVCLPNVFLASRRENITYSGFTRLQADINCMIDHWNRSLAASTSSSSGSRHDHHPGETTGLPWRYLVNLPSQEFPLKTNLELVKILTIYNGSNDIEGITGNRMMANRFRFKHVYRPGKDGRLYIVKTDMKHEAPPHNLTVVKGSAYGIFSRDFIDFVLHDRRAIDLLEWSRAVNSPDEYYWATLHHSSQLHVPGGYHGAPDEKPWLAVYASWPPRDLCRSGKVVRGICIFGVGDLPQLVTRKELFANKFYLNFEPQALHCLDQWLVNKSYAAVPMDTFYYRQLPFVRKG